MQTMISVRVYGYRWVVLGVFALITAVIEVQWLTFAPIAREARLFYDVSPLAVDFLSLIFMGVFLIVCIPASWVIDSWGLRPGLIIGAVLTGGFSLMKGLFAHSYAMVVLAQIGLAVAQPFILNAATKVAALWFPLKERAIAVGIGTLAQFVGIIIVMVATPVMIGQGPDIELSFMLMTYGWISVVSAIILIIFLREKPPVPPEAETSEMPPDIKESASHILSRPDMKLVFPMFFIGLGMFNAISTCLDQVCQLKGLNVEQTGLIGGIMLVAGILGAIILPLLSDRYQRRKAFIVLAMAGMAPGLAGLVFFNAFIPVLVSSFVMGFFLLGAGAPVGFQYCAEITRPAPESLSQGLLLFTGQISGVLFILFMNLAGIYFSMLIFLGLALINIGLSLGLRESAVILAARLKDKI